jgi:hypothetical protein
MSTARSKRPLHAAAAPPLRVKRKQAPPVPPGLPGPPIRIKRKPQPPPKGVTPAKVTPAKVTPAKVAPAKVAPAKVAPAKVAPAKVAPAKVAPARIPLAVVPPKPGLPPWLPPFRIIPDDPADQRGSCRIVWAMRGAGTLRTAPAGFEPIHCENRREAQELLLLAYHDWLMEPVRSGLLARIRSELRGRLLACRCGPRTPCHGDVLLELANREEKS